MLLGNEINSKEGLHMYKKQQTELASDFVGPYKIGNNPEISDQ